ncbi:hypothetical protein GGR24_000728 [Hansschlegelia beijingensis]|uniref:Uncharacterized protein n=1 Tax=Hansschlegelia beijingensis TaxID=1133344 RepID=A0A7W6GED7_9HYPH|nr:hypothetical protein [Hansschlegelia beijingensis]
MSTLQTFPNAARPQGPGPAWAPMGCLPVIRGSAARVVGDRMDVATAARDGANS